MSLNRRLAVRARRESWISPPPEAPICLPQDDLEQEHRALEVRRARERYRTIPITQKLDLPIAWAHRTLERIPEEERYPRIIRAAKGAALAALRISLDVADGERWTSFEELAQIFSPLETPAAHRLWPDDREFARQAVQGPNPAWIENARGVEFLRERGLSAASLEAAGLLERSDAGFESVYIVDLDRPFGQSRPSPGYHLYPCIGVFEERNEELRPVGVQFRMPSGDRIFRPADGSHMWRLAQLYYGCAEFFVHEVIPHWLWTHTVGEKIALFTARSMSWRHPIRRLLAPHLATTLQMNDNAHPILIGAGGVFDRTFAGAEMKVALVEWGDSHWHFDEMIPARSVRRRGMEKLAYYPYRDDAQVLWDATTDYAQACVEAFYADDQAVVNDREVAAWSDEAQSQLGAQGFPRITGRQTLTEVLAAALFNPFQHAMVNSLQFHRFGWIPSAPVNIPLAMPEDPSAVGEQTLIRALPSVRLSLETVRFMYAFCTQYGCYGEGLEAHHVGLPTSLLPRLRNNLQAAADELSRAEARRGNRYWISSPLRIGNSIDA